MVASAEHEANDVAHLGRDGGWVEEEPILANLDWDNALCMKARGEAAQYR